MKHITFALLAVLLRSDGLPSWNSEKHSGEKGETIIIRTYTEVERNAD
jgi:hypothetical protein